MALTTLASVRTIPKLSNPVAYTDAWLNALIAAASQCIKRYCKQNLELAIYGGYNPTSNTTVGDGGYYNGNQEVALVLRQKPAWSGTTTVADTSNGAVLPTGTINVAATKGFNPNGGTIAVQTAVSTFTAVTYTGVTSTTFTGCTGGTGTLNSATNYNAVGAPVVWTDPNGRYGANPNGFPTVLAPGTNYALFVDGVDPSGNPISNRGLLQRVTGGGGAGFNCGWSSPYGNPGKLAVRSLPVWEYGQGNVKVAYSAGYLTVPDDLQFCCNTLVANMVRNQPAGATLGSENLGAYSYSVLQQSLDRADFGSLSSTLALYRDISI